MKSNSFLLPIISALLLIGSCKKETVTEPAAQEQQVEEEVASANRHKSELHVGQKYQGGTIFYVDETGKHGLIVAPRDLGMASWGCSGSYISGTSTDGQASTRAILEQCQEPGIAARLCDDFVVWIKDNKHGKHHNDRNNGRRKKYDDWYLPSVTEIKKLTTNNIVEGGLLGNSYWTSTDNPGGTFNSETQTVVPDYRQTVSILFTLVSDPDHPSETKVDGASFQLSKNSRRRVLPIRAF